MLGFSFFSTMLANALAARDFFRLYEIKSICERKIYEKQIHHKPISNRTRSGMISGNVQNRKFRQNTEHKNYESSIFRSRENKCQVEL